MNYRQRHRQQHQRRHRYIWGVLLLCLLTTFAYLRTRLWVVDLSYEYHDLQKELNQLKDDNAKLRLEVGKLRSPTRLERLAREQLGLKRRDEIRQTTTVMLRRP